MLVDTLTVDNFRNYQRVELQLGKTLNVAYGHNGAGKTNILEALYFGCTGRSCRTANERELIRSGCDYASVSITISSPVTSHRLDGHLVKGEGKSFKLDGYPIDRIAQFVDRPLAIVFLPDRLTLIKGQPANRRGHLDQLCTVLSGSYESDRKRFSEVLAQRNALLGKIKAGFASDVVLSVWDRQLVDTAAAVFTSRKDAVERLAPLFSKRASELGVVGDCSASYRFSIDYSDSESYLELLNEKRSIDISRGFSGYGPHRDDLELKRDGKELKRYGSQGEQRLSLLALLIAEHQLILQETDRKPILLLDDVMSELDRDRRRMLTEILLELGGQTLITTTDLEHLPKSAWSDARFFKVDQAEVSSVEPDER